MVFFGRSSLGPPWTLRISTNVCQTIVCICGGLCCLLPLLVQPTSYLEESRLRRSLSALSHRDSAVAVLALIAPILLDIGTEVINSFFGEAKVKSQKKEVVLNNMEQLVFLCGTAIVPITVFIPEPQNWAYIYLCCKQCQFVLSGGAIAISLCRYDKKYYPVRIVNIMLGLLTIASIMGAFTNNYILIEPLSQTVRSVQTASYGMLFTCSAIFSCCSARWLHKSLPILLRRSKILRRLKLFVRVMPTQTSYKGNETLFFPVVYVVTSVLATLYILVLANYYSATANYTVTSLFFHNLAFFFYVLLITYGSTRMMKQEIVRGLYALIESKKMYVRYISHELRTPMNSACLGLKLVSDNLRISTYSKDADHLEILLDVKAACRTAVQILDDLLCFDKLESGILEMHKHEVPVTPFISECVSMFTSQAKEAGVTMSVIAPQKDLHGESLTPILEGDTVYMDKFKMDQVLRNLISNALKFTPRGGSVSVSSSFVPTVMFSVPLRRPSRCGGGRVDRTSHIVNFCRKWNCFQWTSNIASRMLCVSQADIEQGSETSSADHSKVSVERTRPSKSFEGLDSIHGKLVIVVTDTGAGISAANQQRLFNEIVQFNPEVLQAGGGSGLGLWITNSLVGMHNGTVRVYSAGEGMGSSFTAEIEMHRRSSLIAPSTHSVRRSIHDRNSTVRAGASKTKRLFIPSENPDMQVVEVIPSYTESPVLGSCLSTSMDSVIPRTISVVSRRNSNGPIVASTQNYDILVVDDSSLNRKMLCRVLRTSGHLCDEADDGLSAIEKVKLKMADGSVDSLGKNRCYDVILMDFVMPNMDGPTATKVIRDLGYTGSIFGVTGNALDSDVNHFLSHGADSVLAKPFDYSTFLHLMKNV